MNKRIPFVSFVCLPSLWLFACGSQADLAPERTDDTTLTQQQLLTKQVDHATLTLQEAIDIAVAKYPDGRLLEADLDGKSTQPRFEIELLVAGDVIEIHVDAQTGEILASFAEDSDRDDDGDSEHSCEAGISPEQAVAIAETHVGGGAVEVEYDDCAFEIVVSTGSGLVEVDVANDGSVGRVETDDDSDDRDDDSDDRDDDCSASVSVEQATAIALEAVPGTVSSVEHDDCDFEFHVQTATGVVEVDVSADGTVTDVELDD